MSDQSDSSTLPQEKLNFQSHPDRYKHLRLEIDGSIAKIYLDIQEDQGARPGYELKLNSYDIGVDIELADAVNRLRFEHPEVSVVCIESAREDMFCAGANIYMLRTSTHSHKVNFCKFTNETRLHIEEATEKSGQYYVASLNGGCAGGGYELALACAEIHLIDDRNSAVSLPETPYLAVLPGTGGLTRLVDKRGVRRDLADVFCTKAEGVRGRRALNWNLVDYIHPPSSYDEKMEARLEELAEERDLQGIDLGNIACEIKGDKYEYEYVTLEINDEERRARLTIQGPGEEDSHIPDDPAQLGADWYALQMWRELADAIYHLRFNYPDVGVVTLHSMGDPKSVLSLDKALVEHKEHWFVREVLLHMGRVLKTLDVSAKSFYAQITPGSSFAGSLFEIALAADRQYMLDHIDHENCHIALSQLNRGALPMGHNLSRLENRFYNRKEVLEKALARQGELLDPQEAEDLELVTFSLDDIDWEEELRISIEERLSLSPDALTGMEANLRFVGPETMETRIFGRLSAWQNWIFTRPNATGEQGALTSYGKAVNPEFDWRRT